MHLSIKPALLFALVIGLSLRTAHAQSVTPPLQEPPVTRSEPGGDASRQTVGWVLAGAGGASLLGSSFLVLLRNQKVDDMRGTYGADVADELQPYQTAATALFVVGVAGIAVGLPLALVGDDDTHVVVSPERVVVRGTF